VKREEILRLDGLCVGYHGQTLIRDIRASLHRGQILTLIGPNGAGKSTILRTLTRQLDKLGGAVLLDGRDMAGMRGGAVARQLAMVSTERIRPEMMTCYDVVASGRYPYTGRFGTLTEADRAVVRRSLDQVDGGALADKPFGTVSDGQRQRVMIARALCQEPRVLVLDEPTSFLDVRYKLELSGVLLRLAREQGMTIVMSLHEIDLAARLSDLVMCVGGDAAPRLGTPEEVFTAEGVAALYGIRQGGYDPQLGGVELPRPAGKPRCFVLGGGGRATPVYRRLQRQGIPFVTGILFDNDADCASARRLASAVFETPAFMPAEDAVVAAAEEALAQCERLIDPGTPIRGLNACCGRLIDMARARGLILEREGEDE